MALENTVRGALLVGAVALAGCKTAESQFQSTGIRPIYPSEARCPEVSSFYADLMDQDGSRREKSHNGMDIPAPIGTPVRAIASGQITSVAGPIVDRGYNQGYTIEMRHLNFKDDGLLDMNRQFVFGEDFRSHYVHLSKDTLVQAGQRVKRGDVIGYIGPHYIMPHLHLGGGLPNGPFLDPLMAYAGDFSARVSGKRVPIAYVDQNGAINPPNATVVWPIACVKK